MRFGFHLSIGKGLSAVLNMAKQIGCETVQIFGRNPRQWRGHRFKDSEITAFAEKRKATGIWPLVVHLFYLPNLAAGDEKLYRRSQTALAEEWNLTKRLGAEYLVIHPGHHLGAGRRVAHERIARAIAHVLANDPPEGPYPMLLLENGAGQGSEVGVRFGELRRIRLLTVEQARHVGYCIDTAHAFAAGYRLNHKDGFDDFLEAVKLELGLHSLKLIHLNDSKTRRGSRVDRHWHVGCGAIGTDGLRRLIRHPDLRNVPAVMETPKKSMEDDLANLYRVKNLQ